MSVWCFLVLLLDIQIKFCCGHNCTFFQIHYFILYEKNAQEISIKILGITNIRNYGRANNSDIN